MAYLRGFTSEQSAKDYSKECRDLISNPTMTVEYLFNWAKHPTLSEWMLIIPEPWIRYVKPEDVDKLFTELGSEWFSDPAIVDNKTRQNLWRQFGNDLIDEFTGEHSHITGANAKNLTLTFSPVLLNLQAGVLGGALAALNDIPADPTIFPQATKDKYIQKITDYLALWN